MLIYDFQKIVQHPHILWTLAIKLISAYLTLLALYFHYRAENGPCGYKLEPVNSNRTKLLWIINSDLKVSYYVYTVVSRKYAPLLQP